jgi:hypothetical protein
MEIANFLKMPKTSMSYLNNHIEDYIMFNYVLNKNLGKSKNQRFYRQNKLIFWHPILQHLGNVSHMVASRIFSKI